MISENAIEIPETFCVSDASSANWVIRRINEARRYARHVQQWAEAEQRRAQREEQFFLHRYGHQLEGWARGRIAQRHDGRKSVFLPAGSVGFRTGAASLAVRDEESLLAWCKKNLTDAVRVHESVLRYIVLDHLRTTGEIADGAELVGGDERFFIKEQKNEGPEEPTSE